MKHGTLAGYQQDKCRCVECRAHYSRYMKRLRYERFVGAPSRLVDAGPAHEHIAGLRASGMSMAAIALAAGRRRFWVYALLDASRCQPATLARVLAIQPFSDRRPQGYVDATGTVGRLRDLARLGWSMRWVATELGMDPGTVHDIVNGRKPRIRRATGLAILKLHAQIGGTRGPSARTAAWAASRFPDDAPAGGVCGTCEDAAWLSRSGELLPQIAARLGMAQPSLERHLYRHGRADLASRVAS